MQPDPKTKTPVRDTTLGILVSLYLILLGFFAVLNAVSQDRVDKTGAALESVNTSFKARRRAGPEVVDLLAGGGPAAGRDSLPARLGRIFENAVVFEGRFPRTGEGSLRLQLPRDDVFSEQGGLRDKALSQFKAFGEMISAFDSRRRIEVAVTVGTADPPPLPEATRAPPTGAQTDAMVLARALYGLEGFRDRLGVGYAGIAPDLVQLRLRLSAADRAVPEPDNTEGTR